MAKRRKRNRDDGAIRETRLAPGTGFRNLSIYRDHKVGPFAVNFDEVLGFYRRGRSLVFVMRGGGEVQVPASWEWAVLGEGMLLQAQRDDAGSV